MQSARLYFRCIKKIKPIKGQARIHVCVFKVVERLCCSGLIWLFPGLRNAILTKTRTKTCTFGNVAKIVTIKL